MRRRAALGRLVSDAFALSTVQWHVPHQTLTSRHRCRFFGQAFQFWSSRSSLRTWFLSSP